MSEPIYRGLKVVGGIPDSIKPIIGLPDGTVRLRFRHDAIASAFVRTESSVEHFWLTNNGETWGVLKRGENVSHKKQ